MSFEKLYQVNYYNCDENLRLSIPSLLRFFEDLAITHSEASGLGFDFYTKNDVAWFLTRWLVKIDLLPQISDTIKIITTPKSFINFYANREYSVYNEKGQKIISADTLWVFLDSKSRKPKRIPEEVYKGYGLNDDGKKHFTKLVEIKPATTCMRKSEYKILRRDLDYNEHVNNTQFVSYAFELIPVEVQTNFAIKELSVNYLQEAYLGDDISVELEEMTEHSDLCFINTIKKNENDLCRIKSVWKKN